MNDKNTSGQNRFREVRLICKQCSGSQTTCMQCDIGEYKFECALCNERTTHTVTEEDPRKIKTVFHDCDGSVFIYDQHQELIESWPEGWPKTIGDVRTFCRARGIYYKQ